MIAETQQIERPSRKSGLRGIHILWIVLATILVTAVVTFWVVRTYVYAKDFEPVELSIKEQQTLNAKLKVLGYNPEPVPRKNVESDQAPIQTDKQWLKPERYTESENKRQVNFSERELNAVLAKNQDLAKKLAVDLSDDLVSARLLIPVDQDFPILGGKTLRVSAGVEMTFNEAKPIVILKGVSVMGVPIPNAWLGGLKNIDLINEFGGERGFWKSFAEGVDNISIEEGQMKIKLKK